MFSSKCNKSVNSVNVTYIYTYIMLHTYNVSLIKKAINPQRDFMPNPRLNREVNIK